MTNFKYALGCRKSPPDSRDRRLTALPPTLRPVIPASVDYTPMMSPVSNQGSEGTCVGFAVVDGMKEYQEKAEWKKLVHLSARYVYHNAQKIDPWDDDSIEGTDIRSAMKVLNKLGVPPASCWKYKPHQTDSPCPNADELAAPNRISEYVYLETLNEMRESLFINGPFVAGVQVYGYAWGNAEKTGKIHMPGPDDDFAGGHAICIVGYDNKTHYFKFKNSWGRKWGASGYGYIPYAYLRKYSNDCWSGKDLLADKKVQAFIQTVLAKRRR